ncbi:MAG: inverse autotransporter beta domain-containing protein [Veillonellales bacterium]
MKKLSTLLLASMIMATGTTSVFAEEISGKDATVSITNALISQEIQNVKINNKAWLARTDIQLQMDNNMKPTLSIETVQPFHRTDTEATFYQLRVARNPQNGTTTNIGTGYRHVTDDKNTLTGVNLFYDRAWKYGHERVGLGGEYFHGLLESRYNIYHPISGEKLVDAISATYEKAISGADYEVGMPIPHMPYMKIFLQGYQWDYQYSDDVKGYKLRSEIQVTPQLQLEVGYSHDNYVKNNQYVNLMYTLGQSGKVAMLEAGKPIIRRERWEKVDNSKRLLDKVERENDIRVERYSKQANGIIVSLTN